MNFSKNIKWQVVLAALGFSLIMSARANSQEIVNTEFATPSTSVSGNFNTVSGPEVNAAAVAPQSAYTPANAISTRANNEMQQLNAASSPSLPKDAGVFVAIAFVLLCCAVLRKVMANRYHARPSWNSSPVRANALPSRKPQPILS